MGDNYSAAVKKAIDFEYLYLKNKVDVKNKGDFPILKICYDDKSLNKLCVDKLIKAGVDVAAKDPAQDT